MGPVVSGRCSTTFECARTILARTHPRNLLSKIRVNKVLASAQKLVAWPTRIQFVKALAARCDKVR